MRCRETKATYEPCEYAPTFLPHRTQSSPTSSSIFSRDHVKWRHAWRYAGVCASVDGSLDVSCSGAVSGPGAGPGGPVAVLSLSIRPSLRDYAACGVLRYVYMYIHMYMYMSHAFDQASCVAEYTRPAHVYICTCTYIGRPSPTPPARRCTRASRRRQSESPPRRSAAAADPPDRAARPRSGLTDIYKCTNTHNEYVVRVERHALDLGMQVY